MDDTIRTHLLRQGGVISRGQALAAGLTPRQIDRLTASHEWLTVRRGIYRLHASPPLPETSLWAASLWLGRSALLADVGAAWWWELLPDPPSTWVFATRLHRRTTSDVRLLDTAVAVEDRAEHRGLDVLARPWTVLRTAGELEGQQPGSGIAFIDRMKQTRVVTHAEMAAALGRHPGCRGSGLMRQLLVRTGDEAHSELERMAVSLLRGAGIDGFVVNHRTTLSGGDRVEIDVAFVERRVAIELDGFAFHSSPQAFRDDLRRSNLLMSDGWTVRRFSYSDLLGDPAAFVDVVLELLRA